MTKALLIAVAAGVLISGCSASAAQPEAAPRAPSPVDLSPDPEPSLSPIAVKKKAAVKAVNPLTGLAPRKGPVVVIKVDNAATARPFQRGLNHAAVVYQELVESGQTRFAAVYDGSWSGEVGPIRSARETDIELLAQYGRVTLGFSGANKGVMRTIRAAARKGRIIDAAEETIPGLYREGVRRRDAYNFFSTPARLGKARPGVGARDIGFDFGPLPKRTGKAVRSARITFSEYSTVTARYNGKGRWVILQDGRPMPGVAAANVIVQTVAVRGSRYVDVLGARTPYMTTVGRGNAVLLRDGKLIRGQWRRLTANSGTRFLDAKGKDLPMKPGPTWILLQPKGLPSSFR